MLPDDDARHGRNGYRLGCKCPTCRRAVADYMASRRRRQYLARTNILSVPSLGIHRRIQALVALGWSQAEVSRQAGYDRCHVSAILRRSYLQAGTADRIKAVYDRLCMTLPPETTKVQKIDASRARKMAAKMGWAPPMAWLNIDDENERPSEVRKSYHPGPSHDSIDEVVIQRVLTGDFNIHTTAAERAEVCRRWAADGRSLRQLEVKAGWKPERYYRINNGEGEAA